MVGLGSGVVVAFSVDVGSGGVVSSVVVVSSGVVKGFLGAVDFMVVVVELSP